VKAPRAGEVKTRLAAALGPDLAAQLYRAIAERGVRETSAPGYERAFFHAPADAADEIGEWLGAETRVAQSGPDLGARMTAAFEWAFARGASRVALVGTDVPDLSRDHVLAAFISLDTHDVVLGPCTDGGYYLVALRRPARELFAGITWSTAAVLSETLARAVGAGLHATLLAPLSDIDDVHDLRAAWATLRGWLPADLAIAIESALALEPPSGP
jgi:rSAM/selenodomain-associated transferase 1